MPRLPRKVKVDVAKCHACHAKCRGITGDHQRPAAPKRRPSGAQAAPKRRPSGAHVHHRSQPSAISATPATQNEGGCDQVPRLPRETKVDVTKCHVCHAKCRGVTGDQRCPSGAQACHRSQPSAVSATPATQSATVTKLCVKDGKVVGERWCVTKLCVKDGV